uniref:Uncharacterized protein n=1 Tax=Romanomermis culicivorax TaxID=13658 RepID=A0A915JFJ9_ROMCU
MTTVRSHFEYKSQHLVKSPTAGSKIEWRNDDGRATNFTTLCFIAGQPRLAERRKERFRAHRDGVRLASPPLLCFIGAVDECAVEAKAERTLVTRVPFLLESIRES